MKFNRPDLRHLKLTSYAAGTWGKVGAILFLLCLVNFCQAQTLYWDGGSVNLTTNGDSLSQGTVGTWDNSIQNWDQGTGLGHIAWSSGADGVFAATGITPGAGLVTLGAAITANSITVTSTNYVFTDGGNTANTLTINSVTNSTPVTVSNNIVNSTGFTKAGSSTLTLLAASPGFTGDVLVTNGTLAFGTAAASAPTGPQSVANVAVATNSTFRINAPATATYSENVSGAGGLTVAGAAYNTGMTLAGNSTFTGSVTIIGGTLIMPSINDSSANPMGLGTNVQIGGNATTSTLQYKGYGDTTSRTLTLGTTGTAGSALDSSGFGPLVWNGPVAFANTISHTFTLTGSSSYLNVFAGAINDGSVSNTVFAKGGTGLWELTASNSFSGGTTLGGGTLLITNDYALGVSTGRVFCSSSTTLKSTNNAVTLGANRWVIVTNTATLSFGVLDTNNLTVASFITGPGAVTKSSSSYALGTVRFSNDTNNFTGTFSASFGNTEFTSVANSGTPSALGTGVTNSGIIVLANSTSAGTLRYAGTNNSSTTRPLNWTGTVGSGYTLDASGAGTIAYLAATTLKSGSGSMTLNLQGTNTSTNTLAEIINDSGGTTSLTKNGSGQWVLTGVNTYGGTTVINDGTLTVSADSNLGTVPGSATPNSLTINGGALSASASFALSSTRGIGLGPTGTNSLSNNGPASGVGTIDVASGQTLTYGGIAANYTSTNAGGLTKTSAGKLTLSGANTYTGNTTINGGTLAVSGGGSIATSTNIIVNAGTTFDVSSVSGGYALVTGQSLVATNGAVATVNGSLNLASAGLVLTNVINTPTITVTGGTLTLGSGMAVTVAINNGGAPLGAGSYKLIAKGSGGSVAGPVPSSVTTVGDGLVTNGAATLGISGGELYLVVTGGTLYPPAISNFSLIGGQSVLSFTGTNGQTWKLLTSTNVALAVTNWTTVVSGTFSNVVVNYTNPSPTEPKRFYLITSP